MQPLINNRYAVLRTLGEGGMGTVYLVEDTLRDRRRLALKRIRADLLSGQSLAQFKNEFSAMAQLRHPNLVEVYDFGTLNDADDYFFTMEYIPGEDWPTLAERYRQMGSSRSAFNRLYEITVEVCRALQYIHARGFIHYDVKPRNVRITPSGVVKLMDFGLVGRAHGGGVPTRGTPEYIAPEVIQGKAVDHRADFYSLGVSLYEVATSTLPFDDASSGMILKHHVETPLEFSDELSHELPEALQGLIHTLMAKEPAARYRSANDVIHAINTLTGLSFPLETRETKRGYVQSGAFVGRAFELARLQGLMMRMQQGQGRLVLITGVAGIGKTRLARELRLQAQLQRVIVCEGACYEYARSPYRPWITIVRQVAAHYRQTAPEVIARFAPRLVRLMPQLQSALELKVEVSGDAPANGVGLAEDTPLDKPALLAAAADFLLAHGRPMLILLEDLHHADAESLELLDVLGARARREHLLLMGLYRNDEVDEDHPLQTLVRQARTVSRRESLSTPEASRHTHPYECLRLRLLSEAEVADLVKSMLGIAQDAEPQALDPLLPRLMAETGGNPLFVESLMHNLVEEDLLHHDGDAWQIAVEDFSGAPVSIQAAAQRRLARLDAETLDLVQWAAVMGQWLDVDVLAEVASLDNDTFFQRLGQAMQHHVLVRAERAGELHYRFSNDQMRATVYDTLSEAVSAERHARIGEALAARYPESQVVERLAWHFEQAGQRARALRYARGAGDKALASYANESAVQYYSQALEHLDAQDEPQSELRYAILAGRAQAHARLGAYQKQLADLAGLAEVVDALGDARRKAEVSLQQAEVAVQLGNSADALKTALQALELARQLQDRALEAESLDEMGGAHFAQGQLERAYECHEQALEISREIEDAQREAHNLWHLGSIAELLGRSSEAYRHLEASLRLYRELRNRSGEADALNALGITSPDYALQRDYHEQSLAIAQATGDQYRQMRSYNNLGLTYWSLGLYGRARDLLEQAVQVGRDMRARTALAHLLETLGRIDLALGEYILAQRLFEEGRTLAADTGNRATESIHQLALGRVKLARGDTAGAVEALEAAVAMQREMNLGSYLITSLAWLGAAYLELGDWEAAERNSTAALKTLETSEGGEYPPQEVWWLRYQVLKAAPPSADVTEEDVWEALRQAHATMMTGIATLSDEGLRRNYLNKVQINHDIITEWTRYLARRRQGQVLDEVAGTVELERDEAAEAARLKDRLRRILEISVRMNETHDPDSLLTYVMDQVIELSGAERGFLVFVEPDGQFDFKVAVGMEIEALEEAQAQVSYTVIGSVAQSRQPVLLQDALTDERFGAQSSVLELNLRSVLCVPLVSGAELVGIIYADNRSVSGRFSQADLDLMMIFANQAASAIENARLYGDLYQANAALEDWARTLEERVSERTAELQKAHAVQVHRAVQLETSAQVGRQITSILELDDLLAQVVRLIQTQFGYYFVGVWLLNPAGDALLLQASSDRQGQRLHERDLSIRLDAPSISASVCRSGQARYVPRVEEVEDYLYVDDLPDIASELVLPMFAGEILLGTLNISSDQAADFPEDDRAVLQGLADQIATAIRNARLYAAEQDRRQLTELLEQAGRALTSSLDVSEVPWRILALLNDLVPYERGAVFLQQDHELKPVAHYGFPADERMQLMTIPVRENDVYSRLVKRRGPVMVNDIMQEPGWNQVVWLPLNRSWLGVPLMAKGRVLGMISLTRREAGAFDDEDATWVQAFAAQAGIALENARFHAEIIRLNEQLEQRVQERTEELNQANAVLAQLDKTKSNFINVAAHELRTPLTVIRGYSQILRMHVVSESPDKLSRMLEGIIAGTDRLHDIVNSMLDVAKIDSQALNMTRKATDLSEVIRRVHIGFMSALEDRELDFTVAGVAGLPEVQADPELLYKLFYQLIINAIKYTPDGGAISVAGREIKLEGVVPAVEIVVRDTGIGIAPDDQPLVFEKFHLLGDLDFHSSGRTKFKGGGPGLGLAIARGIVLAHGGKIWVESEGYDEERCPGSKFYVQLPVGNGD